jgi:hypothetical protein
VKFMRGPICISIGIACAGAAEAAPWTRDDGGYYARVALSAEEISGLNAVRLDLYGEYGLRDNLTLTVKSEAVNYVEASDFDSQSLRVTLRRELWAKKGWVAAIEGGPVYGTAVAGVFGCDTIGAEARLSGGISGKRGVRDFYAFSDLAVTAHADGCQRTRAEFGYGVEIVPDWWLSQQVWLEQGNQSATSHKFETSLARRFDAFDISLGYREEIGGRFEEKGLVIAVIRKI